MCTQLQKEKRRLTVNASLIFWNYYFFVFITMTMIIMTTAAAPTMIIIIVMSTGVPGPVGLVGPVVEAAVTLI
jgi:hypothetical protein